MMAGLYIFSLSIAYNEILKKMTVNFYHVRRKEKNINWWYLVLHIRKENIQEN